MWEGAERQSRAERRCYQKLNEPGETTLPFAFDSLRAGSVGLPSHLRPVFHTQIRQPLKVSDVQRSQS